MLTLGNILDSTPKLGRYLLVLPMLIYPVFHFLNTRFVANIVPPWIPGRVFWTYFTGTTIMAAGLAITFKRYAHLAGILLGVEILLFVLLIHVFLIFHKPGDAWVQSVVGSLDLPGRLNNAFKDLGLSAAVFVFAGTQSEAWRKSGEDGVLTFGRLVLASCIAAFGVLHFLYPGFAPGIPPMSPNIPFLIPGHLFWVYFSGIAFLVAAVCILINKEARLAATLLGITILVFDLLTWVPRFSAHPGAILGNWLKDLGIAGGLLILAGAFPRSAGRGKPQEVKLAFR